MDCFGGPRGWRRNCSRTESQGAGELTRGTPRTIAVHFRGMSRRGYTIIDNSSCVYRTKREIVECHVLSTFPLSVAFVFPFAFAIAAFVPFAAFVPLLLLLLLLCCYGTLQETS